MARINLASEDAQTSSMMLDIVMIIGAAFVIITMIFILLQDIRYEFDKINMDDVNDYLESIEQTFGEAKSFKTMKNNINHNYFKKYILTQNQFIKHEGRIFISFDNSYVFKADSSFLIVSTTKAKENEHLRMIYLHDSYPNKAFYFTFEPIPTRENILKGSYDPQNLTRANKVEPYYPVGYENLSQEDKEQERAKAFYYGWQNLITNRIENLVKLEI
ncbi:hypothetical protein K8I28_14780 [bacterium]|nr:hypothetical protein [bacterium]